jgi:hypothetical protein
MDQEKWLKSPGHAKILAEEVIETARILGHIKRRKWLAVSLANMPRSDDTSRDEAIRRAFLEGARAAYYGMLAAYDVPAEKECILDELFFEFSEGLEQR